MHFVHTALAVADGASFSPTAPCLSLTPLELQPSTSLPSAALAGWVLCLVGCLCLDSRCWLTSGSAARALVQVIQDFHRSGARLDPLGHWCSTLVPLVSPPSAGHSWMVRYVQGPRYSAQTRSSSALHCTKDVARSQIARCVGECTVWHGSSRHPTPVLQHILPASCHSAH